MLPQSWSIASAVRLALCPDLLLFSFTQLCNSPKWGETSLPTVLRHKETYSRSPKSIHHSCNSTAYMRLVRACRHSFFVLLKVISKLIFSSYCLMIPNSLTFSRCACFIIDKFHLYFFLSQQNFSESNNIHRVSLFP